MTHPPEEIGRLLERWNAGESEALANLTPVVYDELRRLARALLTRERPGHTMSATELVHEAFMRLADQQSVSWENRSHFFGAAANIMRRVLVDHAKRKFAGKRGGLAKKIAMDDGDALAAAESAAVELVELDEALDRLKEVDGRKAAVVELKFFGGMTNAEIASALGISDATVERDWRMARAWLIQNVSS